MLPILLFACTTDPLAVEKRAEAVFYDADMLATQGLPLVPVQRGEPLQPGPRIVIRADRIAVDNRAWWVATMDDRDANLVDRRTLVVDHTVVEVDAGRTAPEDVRHGELPALLERLVAIRDAHPDAGRLYQVFAHPDTELRTLEQVLRTAAAAGYAGYQLVARVGDVPRSITTIRDEHPPYDCTSSTTLHPHEEGVILPLRSACPAPVSVIVPTLVDAAATCVPHWDALAGLPPIDLLGRRVPPEDPAAWRCIQVHPVLVPDADVADLYPALDALQAAGPAVTLSSFTPDEPPPVCPSDTPQRPDEAFCSGRLQSLLRPDPIDIRELDLPGGFGGLLTPRSP